GDDHGAVAHLQVAWLFGDGRGHRRRWGNHRLRGVVDFLRPLRLAGPRKASCRLRPGERVPDHRQIDAVLRPLWSGDGWTNRTEVDLDELVKRRRRIAVRAEHALRLRVALDEIDELGRSPGLLEVAERLAVDREERARGAVLGAHVRDGRALGDGERREAVAGELDELVHHALLP